MRRGWWLALAVVATIASAPLGWRQVATERDHLRLRDWRTAWMIALDKARADGGEATIAADPTLFDADGAMVDGAMPPAGDYRCRRVAMGARRGLAQGAWGSCRIEGEAPPRRLTTADGAQRLIGLIHADSDRRAVFLGTTLFADERRPAGYGHAAGRDVPGIVERIGERRWRLVLPYPVFGGALDLIELAPA